MESGRRVNELTFIGRGGKYYDNLEMGVVVPMAEPQKNKTKRE